MNNRKKNNSMHKVISDLQRQFPNFSNKQVSEMTEFIFKNMVNKILEQSYLEVKKFGIFRIVMRKAKILKIPTLEQPKEIPPHYSLLFKASARFTQNLIKKIKE